jgi:hypothetical protein
MSIVEKLTGVDPQILKDRQAIYRHAFEGIPLSPEIAERVRERTRAITDRVSKEYGAVDVVQLVRDGRP